MSGSRRSVEAGRAFVEFFLKDGKLRKGLSATQRRLRMWAKRVGNIMRTVLRVSTIGLAAFALPTTVFAQFDDQMRTVKAVTGATDKDFKILTATAKELGRTTGFTAREVAGLMTELGRAGFSPDEINDASNNVLNLAYATGTELPRAAEIAAASMRTFGIAASESERVADVMTKTTNSSAQGMEDLFEAMKMVAPIASKAKASIEETAAAVGILANNGIKGSMAGTALARAYKNLSSSSTAKTLQSIGVKAADSADNLRPMSEILSEIGEKTRSMGTRKRLSIFESLFGRGQAAALSMADASANYDDLLQKIKDSEGAAAKAAAEMDAGIGGAIRRLKSAWEGLLIGIGAATSSQSGGFFDTVTKWLGWLTRLVEKYPEVANWTLKALAATAALSAGGLALTFAIRGIAAGLGVFAMGLKLVVGAASLAVGAVKMLATGVVFLASPLGIAIGLVGGLVAWFVYLSGAVQKVSSFLNNQFAETWKTVVGLLKAGELEAAGKLAMELLGTAWDIGVARLQMEWEDWTSGIAGFLLDGIAGAKLAWEEFATFLTNTIDIAMAEARERLQLDPDNFITRAVAALSGLDGDEVVQTQREDQERNKGRFRREAAERVKRRQDASKEAKAKIVQDRFNQREALDQAHKERLDNIRKRELKARQEFEQSQAKAAALLEKKEEEKKEEEKPEFDPQADSVQQGLFSAVAATQQNNALNVNSEAGQQTLARVMGFAIETKPVVSAVESMHKDVHDELEDQTKILKEAPLIGPAK